MQSIWVCWALVVCSTLVACGEEIKETPDTGGGGNTGNTSTGTASGGGSTDGGAPPVDTTCILDESKLDECTLK